jgi:16S rRNA (cytidine1402-2'-O)-methyltransferase
MTLFVVATPIGNLSDITLRAISVLKDADLVVAEDTRRSRALLTHLGIAGKPVRCIDAHATKGDLDAVVAECASGKSVAVLTDAGTPAVSDPGVDLVRLCREQELEVVPIPGPSAVTTAIAGAGLADGGFWFCGFLPRKGSKRKAMLDRIAAFSDAVVLFESPQRLSETLRDLAVRQPARKACVARELTKKFEEFTTRPLLEWANTEQEFRGEITVVLGPVEPEDEAPAISEEDTWRLAQELATSLGAKEAAAELVTLSGMSKRDAYQLILKVRASDG